MNEFGRAAGDWDLQAIVKGQKTMPTSYACNCFGNSFSLGLDLALELCKPFHQEITPTNFPPKIVENDAVTCVCTDCAKFPRAIEEQKKKSAMSVSNAHSRATTSRRRRNKHKISMVYHAAGEPLLSDKWNWRKYGEKTIKGSPYPRSYYRCSNSGGCLARKQVEQSNTDPGIFLITYIDEHNHPFPTRRHTQAGFKVRRSSNASPELLRTNDSIDLSTPITEDPVPTQLGSTKDDARVEVIEEVGRVSDMAYEDDFFAGLEYLERLEMDIISDQIIPFDPFPLNMVCEDGFFSGVE